MAAIGPGDLAFTMGDGAEVLFPTPGAGDFYWLTLEHGPAEEPLGREIVRCSARAGNSFTIARGQQGTAPQSFPATSTRVELRLTAATMATFQSSIGYSRRFVAGGLTTDNTGGHLYGPIMNRVATAVATLPTPTSTKWGLLQPRLPFASTGNNQIIGSTATPDSTVIGLRGTAPNLGGFELLTRFVIDTDSGAARKILGVSDSTVSDRLNGVDPSALINDAFVAIGQQLATPIGGNWQLYHCDGGGVSVTVVDTGIPKVIGNLYQLRIYSLRGRPTFFVELIDFDDQVRYFAELTTNIPGGIDYMHATLVSRSTGILDGISVVGMWNLLW